MLATFYMLTILMFLNSTSTLIYWILMEINMVSFIVMIKSFKEKTEKMTSPQSLMYYFMIQTLGSMMFLGGLCLQSNLTLEPKMISIMGLILKMGIYPMEKWIFKMTKSMEKESFIILITIQKIPILLVMAQLESLGTTILLIVSMLMGSMLIWKSKNLKDMMVSSSIYSTILMFFSLTKSITMFSLLYMKYTMANIMLMKSSVEMNSKMKEVMMMLATMFLIGLPPLDMFFMKIYILSNLNATTKIYWVMILWIATFLATMGYFKLLYSNFMMKKKDLTKNYYVKSKNMMSLMVIMLILLFV